MSIDRLVLLGGGYAILPLGLFVGGGSVIDEATIDNGDLLLNTGPGVRHTYSRTVSLSSERGAFVEFHVRITRNKPRSRSGYFVVIDDGSRAYVVSFVDTEIGKFVGIAVRSGSGLIEVVGTEGRAALLSAKIDWTIAHTYRLEKRPLDGVYLFVDNDPNPLIFIPESERIEYPLAQFSGTPTVAFGHLGSEGCESRTKFVRVGLSAGYEISTKKVDATAQLEQDIRNSQAVVIAFVEDNDT